MIQRDESHEGTRVLCVYIVCHRPRERVGNLCGGLSSTQ